MAEAAPEAGLTDEHIVNLSKSDVNLQERCESELVELEVKALKLPEFIIDAEIYVVHQQDRLPSGQLRPVFPPAWTE